MRYVSIMDIINRSHRMTEAIQSMAFRHDVIPRYGWWYAEKKLYIVKDEKTGGIYFETARCPKDAVNAVAKRVKEAE